MPRVEIKDVYKIFGDNPDAALELMEHGKDKKEIKKGTGQVVGVQGISFQIDDNELFVIMGLSGSGKSTLLRCVNRLVEPTSGEITLHTEERDFDVLAADGETLRQLREKQISMVFQNFALFPERTVVNNVAFGLEIQGIGRKERVKKAQELIDVVGLSGFEESYPSQLSGGMQQRVGLARGLATGADVLLMDEPFSALDPLIKVEMQDELLDLMEDMERTVLFVTHDLDEALKLGDRITIMEAGEMVQKGTPEEIIVNPKTKYVANFVENADPSNVLKARTIGTTDFTTDDDNRVEIDENYEVELDDQGKVLRGYMYGDEIPIKRMESFDGQLENAIISVQPTTLTSEIMEARLNQPSTPVVITEKERLVGYINEENILNGLLKKGRKGI